MTPRPAPSPLPDDAKLKYMESVDNYIEKLKATNAQLVALNKELALLLEGILDTVLWKETGMRHYDKLNGMCQDALTRARELI